MLAAPDGAAAEGMANKTRPRRRGGASRGSDAGPGTVPDPQAPDRSRCAIGQDTTGRQETDWPGGSNLVRHPQGSNGGVHRGSDRCLRKNVMEGVLLRAMIREGVHLSVTPVGGRRLHRSKISAAMVENLVTHAVGGQRSRRCRKWWRGTQSAAAEGARTAGIPSWPPVVAAIAQAGANSGR